MIDILGIITHAWLMAAAPVMATPAAPAAAAAAAAGAPSAQSASDIVDDVQKFYANIKQVTAQFRQTVQNSTFGTSKDSDGKVLLLKPGKMRWDYYEKKPDKTTWTKRSFISNGTTLYVVEHDNKQVVKRDLNQNLLPVAVTFLYGKGNLKAEFNPAIDTSGTYGGKDDLVLKLTPKQPSAQYKNLYLVVNKTDFHVSQSVIVDSSNNVNHFKFFNPDFDTAIKDTIFDFDPRSVPNYRVVDGDQAQPAAPAPPPPAPAPSAPAKK